jgi:hypothetical protein
MFFVETVDHDLGAEFDPQVRKYPRLVRLAVILGLATALWSVIIVGGWGLYSLFA